MPPAEEFAGEVGVQEALRTRPPARWRASEGAKRRTSKVWWLQTMAVRMLLPAAWVKKRERMSKGSLPMSAERSRS